MKKSILIILSALFSGAFISCEKGEMSDAGNANIVTRSGLDNWMLLPDENGGAGTTYYSFSFHEEVVPAQGVSLTQPPFKFHVTGKVFRNGSNYGINKITVECYNHEEDFDSDSHRFMDCSIINPAFDGTELTYTLSVDYAIFQLQRPNSGLDPIGVLYGETVDIEHPFDP
jgi:hypothetical protein